MIVEYDDKYGYRYLYQSHHIYIISSSTQSIKMKEYLLT